MVLCSNCHVEIDDSKIVLHERFCKQNIKYCEKCKEGIPKEDFDEHMEQHASRKASLSLSESQMSQKEKDDLCLKRVSSSKIGCQYCGMPFVYNELEEHEEICGSKTDICDICHQKFTRKTIAEHILNVHNKAEDEEKIDIKKSISGPLTEEELGSLTEEEMIARAIKQSEKELQTKGNNKVNKPKKIEKTQEELDEELARKLYEEDLRKYQ